MNKLYLMKAWNGHDTEMQLTVAETDEKANEKFGEFYENGDYASGSVDEIKEVDGYAIRVGDPNKITLFFVTTFKKLEEDERWGYEFGSTRTVGFYPTLEQARNIVVNNYGDLCETIYHYALIQEIGTGLYPTVFSEELYRVKDITVMVDGKEVYNPNLTYEKIPLPENWHEHSLTVIG